MQASGYTQGTTYSVVYFNNGIDYQYQIDSLLLAFDRVLSTYQESSYISKWNRNEVGNMEQPKMFKTVVARAKEIHGLTNGSFDITVSPLMSYWFERDWSMTDLDSVQVDSVMELVGMDKLFESDGNWIKTESSVQLDVNAIAQGYSVDVVARFLEGQGAFNYLVEIGGEIRTSGSKDNGESWVVGIDQPDSKNFEHDLALSIELSGKAMATSGNYRKFVEVNGQKLGHTMNPHTGYPATTDILSATVVAEDCMTADAFATACMVLGFDASKTMIERDTTLDAVLIYSNARGVQTWISEGVVEAGQN